MLKRVPSKLTPKDSVQNIPLIGPSYAKKLLKLGIKTLEDLIYYYPFRYQNYSQKVSIAMAAPGERITIQGQITAIKNILTRTRKFIQQAKFSDGESELDIVWFNQPYLVKSLPKGTWLSVSGKITLKGSKKSLIAPQYEKVLSHSSPTIHTGGLIPVYPETSGLSSKWLRAKIAKYLFEMVEYVDEYLPEKILLKNNFIDIKSAIKHIHFPKSIEDADLARKRLAFDEIFKLQLSALERKKKWQKQNIAHNLLVSSEQTENFIKSLPFELTPDQYRAISEIISDLKKTTSMNRLLEGDVGSGKTIVAACCAYVSYLNNFKTIFMAPTQILALQHFQTFKKILSPFGVNVEIIHSGKSAIKNSCHVICGTHAILHKKGVLDNVAVCIIDEQHKFGVAQRSFLTKKYNNYCPHILTMTATPIPRTVAQILYSDLDLSILNELPKNRQKITTWVVSQSKRAGAYEWIRKQIKNNSNQAFIVCPLIEPSDKESFKNIKAASAEFERLSKEIFPDLRLGLLHGRLKLKEKELVMKKFKNGNYDILVSTPVVEVGVDIPQATIMVIEASDRFGLAQLHQLRGRVGRSDKKSYCLLFTQSNSINSTKRLKALEEGLAGVELSELDLKLRGPGEVFGTSQSGFPELKIASYLDFELIKNSKKEAEEILSQINKYPKIKKMLKMKLISSYYNA